MKRRLHAVCPECSAVQPLRPGGALVQHIRLSRQRPCPGGTTRPTPDAVRAWLDDHERDARETCAAAERRVEEARQALAAAQERLDSARTEAVERAAWCERERGKL